MSQSAKIKPAGAGNEFMLNAARSCAVGDLCVGDSRIVEYCQDATAIESGKSRRQIHDHVLDSVVAFATDEEENCHLFCR
jgi:hypothetical protein